MRLMAPGRFITLLLVAAVPVFFLGLMLGPVTIGLDGLFSAIADVLGMQTSAAASQQSLILFSIRLPRVILAGLVGICLAVCGTAMQGLFRNPLADPSLIGVSSGASAGASTSTASNKERPNLPLAPSPHSALLV